ncbi:hypothetical protein ASF24_12725 [Methylobacterium sp. Leaf86]|nr:hypothetical protein ASF24_12725 [Methylobacterium sp. Leaf86]
MTITQKGGAFGRQTMFFISFRSMLRLYPVRRLVRGDMRLLFADLISGVTNEFEETLALNWVGNACEGPDQVQAVSAHRDLCRVVFVANFWGTAINTFGETEC